jgi:hypothetical protein
MKTKPPVTALAVASPMTLSASGISVSETGLTVSTTTSSEDLLQAARIFSAAGNSLTYWTSDLLAAGQKAGIGEQIAQQLAFDFAETKRAIAIASVSFETRCKELTPEHHYVVGRAELSPADQQRWLALAVAEKLSAAELAKSIKLGSVVKTQKKTGFQTLSALKVQFFSWKRQFESNRRIEDLTASEADALLDEMEPILAFADQLANLAGQMEMEVCK